jgi:hypothetical protein
MAVTFRIQRHGACLDSSIEVFRCFDAELSLASAKPTVFARLFENSAEPKDCGGWPRDQGRRCRSEFDGLSTDTDPSNGLVFEPLSGLKPTSIEKSINSRKGGREEWGIANWIFLGFKELG